MSSSLPYCRTNQTSSNVGMIGMITASARDRWTCRRRNGTKRKFFNDFSRARACACAQGGVRSESPIMQLLPIKYGWSLCSAHAAAKEPEITRVSERCCLFLLTSCR
jgi:hypothetical protein